MPWIKGCSPATLISIAIIYSNTVPTHIAMNLDDMIYSTPLKIKVENERMQYLATV